MNDDNEQVDNGFSRDISNDKTEAVFSTDFHHSASLVGQRLDNRFLIEKDVTGSGADTGGFGLVYLARDTKLLGRQVVVKILKKSSLENEEIVRKFQHEKEALIRLDHPNIVRILDSGTLSDGNPFMVMEFISGYSLRKKMRDSGPLSFDFSAHVVESVANALASAHAQKVLHRDVKPENIMLTPQDNGFEYVRLIDFGIARVESSQLAPMTSVAHGMGTINYIAPEQLMGQVVQSSSADIYAFSIVVYEMLTGRLPFRPHSAIEMHEMQKQNVQPKLSTLREDVPPSVDRLLLAGLAYEAAQRPPDARQFGRDLAAALRENVNAPFEVGEHAIPAMTQAAPQASEPTIERSVEDKEFRFDAPAVIDLPALPGRRSSKTGIRVALGLLILAALAVPAGILYWNSSASGSFDQPVAESGQRRTLSYFLNVQKMRNGRPFEAPFRSIGQEIYEDGYKFKLSLNVNSDGYVYVLSEGYDDSGKTVYYILYPTPNTNDGSAAVRANKQVETGNNTFGGGRGAEIVWIIWIREQNSDLESVRTAAFSTPSGQINNSNVEKLRSFLDKYKDAKRTITPDQQKTQMTIESTGDVVLHKAEFQHR